MKKHGLSLVSLALLSASGLAQAGEPSQVQIDSPHYGEDGWDITIGAGVGLIDGAIYQGEDDHTGTIVPLVDVTYQRDRFYFTAGNEQGLVVGYSVLRGESWALDGVLSPKMAAYFEDSDNDELEHLDDREFDLHAGLRATKYYGNGRLGMELSNDVSGTHEGYIASVDYLHEWQLRNWVIGGKVGAAYLSDKTSDYYFGVSQKEATAKYPAHTVDGGTILSASLRAEYPVDEHWIFHTDAGVVKLSDEINDSPITQDDQISLLTVGMKYKF